MVVIDCERICAKPSLGKKDMGRCAQISCPMWSRFFVALCMYLIEESNKEEELVDVSPGWG